MVDIHVMKSAIARFRMVIHAPLRNVFKGSIIITKITAVFKMAPIAATDIVMIRRFFACVLVMTPC